MKHLRALIIGLLVCANAHAQFAPGQVLTASALNAQFALYAPLAGATFTGPLTAPSLSVTGSPVSLASGGTNATTASAALANLGGLPLAGGTLTGALTAPSLSVTMPIAVTSGGTGSSTATGSGSVVLANSPALTGAASVTGSVSSAITADGYGLLGRGNSSLSSNNIYEGAIGPGSNPAPAWDALRGVAISPSGSSVLTTTGVAGYVQNDTVQGSNGFSGAVGVFGVGISDADNTSTWGIDTICTDHNGQVLSTGVGRACFNEFDINVTSPNTTVSGHILGGTWLVQPASATGWTLFKPTGTGQWQYGFGSQDGATTLFARVGSNATTANSTSQPSAFHWRDSSNSDQSTTAQYGPGGLTLTSTVTPTASVTPTAITPGTVFFPLVTAPSAPGSGTALWADSTSGVLSTYGALNIKGSVAPLGSGSGLIMGNGPSYPWIQSYSSPLVLQPLANRVLIRTTTDDGTNYLQVGGPAKISGNLTVTGSGAMPLYSATGTAVSAPHMVQGSVALSSGTATVTLSGSAVFTSSSSYVCTANDTTAAAAVKVGQTSGTSITLTGTSADTVQYLCTGN